MEMGKIEIITCGATHGFLPLLRTSHEAVRAQIDGLEKALEQYRIDTGRFPSTEQGLAALFVKPTNEAKWAGPYLKKAPPPDAWGQPYKYKSPGEHGEIDLFSFGRDGRPGGTAEDADITNW